MSREGKENEEGGLSRWSRLKRQEQGGAAPKPPAAGALSLEEQPLEGPALEEPALEEAGGSTLPVDSTPPEAAEFDVASLPNVDELDQDSDYKPFLAKGVPEDLARLAMRKLWLSDPAFGFRDGLDDYDEDFTIVDKILTALEEGGRKVKEAVKKETPEEEASTPREVAESGKESEDRQTEEGAEEGAEDGGDEKSAAAVAGGKMDTGGGTVVSDGPATTAATEKFPRSNGGSPKRKSSE